MASYHDFPYAQQDVQEVAGLIHGLEAGTKKGKQGYHCKKTAFQVGDYKVDSWRFMDWDYKRDDLPTYSRGLFTTRRRDNTPEIVIRGYDKFFNVGEVNDTQWWNVETRTKGPYELSVKENGCIIFISGLEDGTLLVCSKHSTGARPDTDLSHAQAGDKWVDKQLAGSGRTRQDLARELRSRNVTAIAELCDDTFEEHVLAYDEKTSGLYLHGINLNTPEFATYSGPQVDKFADEWGFQKVQYVIKEDIETTKTFLEQCSETGSFQGKETEGFVIRCKKHERGQSSALQDWFFKYKFEEPYLMYRQWRECTKSMIAGKPPKFKKHKQITEEYLLYAKRQLVKNPALGKAYMKNHGIIAMRDDFLAERGLKGSDIIRQELEYGDHSSEIITQNVILVPIASIGCGKTTVAVALTKLFDWGHIQNDNITGPKGRPKQFATQVSMALAQYPVVIADRNNHQKRERAQIIEDVNAVCPGARFVALSYVHSPKTEMLPKIREITQQRVLERGDNHQTIQAGSKSRTEIVGIMNGFLDRFEPPNPDAHPDSLFDEIIDLDVAADSRQNLETVVRALHDAYPRLVQDIPSSTDLDEAISAALSDYQPTIKHDLSFKSKNLSKAQQKQAQRNANRRDLQDNGQSSSGSNQPKSNPKIEYFGLYLPPNKILSLLETTFSSQKAAVARFYRQLQQSRRIQQAFHVTLIHRTQINTHSDLWNQFSQMQLQASESASPDNAKPSNTVTTPVIGHCTVHLERVVWGNRVMSIVAQLPDPAWRSANKLAHVTIGTAHEGIKPKESNTLLERWVAEGCTEQNGIMELACVGETEVLGEGRAVHSR
ncbi:MAG: hypothetical protein MMC33_006601 [Icmadophila ericetorum]|nr:hypothetical protein [Icmadophila ericetorum]